MTELAAAIYPQAIGASDELDLDLALAPLPVRREDREMMVGDLLENVIHHTSGSVYLFEAAEPGAFRITVADDCPASHS